MSDALEQSENAGAGHTATPWFVADGAMEGFEGEWDVVGPDNCGIASMVGTAEAAKYPRNKEANAHRIVASVNALSELTVEAIEAITATDIENVLIRKATAGRVAELEAVNAELVAACESWVQYFDRLTRHDEPGDKLAEMRRKFHGERIEATRAALVKDAIVNLAALAAVPAAKAEEGE